MTTETETTTREQIRTLLLDRAAAITDLAESYLRGGKKADAKRQTLAALEIAPSLDSIVAKSGLGAGTCASSASRMT